MSAQPAEADLDHVLARMVKVAQPAEAEEEASRLPVRKTRTIRPPADDPDLFGWYDDYAARIGVTPHRALIMGLAAFKAAVERGRGGTTQ